MLSMSFLACYLNIIRRGDFDRIVFNLYLHSISSVISVSITSTFKKSFFIFCNHVCKGRKISPAIEYEIIGEGSQILTNQKRESTVFSLLIGRNLRPFPDSFVLYSL